MCQRRTLAEVRRLGTTIIAWVYLTDVGSERGLHPFWISRRLRGFGTIARKLRHRLHCFPFLFFLAKLKVVVSAVVDRQGRVILIGSYDRRSPASPTSDHLGSNQRRRDLKSDSEIL